MQDELALFAKRLFLLATLIGVLGSLPLRAPAFARRATEYYLAMLASLLGMLVLASARDLILLFVAFELMSIPLYCLAGLPQARAGGGGGGAEVLPGRHGLLGGDHLRLVEPVTDGGLALQNTLLHSPLWLYAFILTRSDSSRPSPAR